MKSIKVKRGGADILHIQAPEGKEMVINDSALANGILSIGEYGPSGQKIAAFKQWDEVIFDCADKGYILTDESIF